MKKAKKKSAKKAEASKQTDHYGFREGTNVSKLFAALLKGAPIEELKKITGAVTSKTMADFKKSQKECSRGRNAVIEVNDKGIYKITKHSIPSAS